MTDSKKFKTVDSKVDFIKIEHEMLEKWNKDDTFNQLRKKNAKGKPWSFLDGPITANNPMGCSPCLGPNPERYFSTLPRHAGKRTQISEWF